MNKIKTDSDSRFGLERETLRVTKDGRLSQSQHPFIKESLSKDFCENQLEIITPVCNSIQEAVDSLDDLSREAMAELSRIDEKLWMCSNPPHFDSENDIPIARYEGDMIAKHDYRLKLERRYGKRLMLYSGIHFNVSFSEAVTGKDQDAFYMKLLKYATRYSWLPTMLTVASPVYDISMDGKDGTESVFSGYASMRNSRRGYWNQFIPVLDYNDLHSYCNSIRRYIDKGALFSEGELYMPVRIKSKGSNSLEQLEKGVDHIELRMFDLNPLQPLGIAKEDLEFAYLWLLYLAGLPDFDFTQELQIQSVHNHQNAAKYDLGDVKIDGVDIVRSATLFLNDMKKFFSDAKSGDIIRMQLDKLNHNNRYAEKIYRLQINDFQKSMLEMVLEK